MFGFSVRRWIPERRREEEMIQQFADSVDWLLSVDFPYADKMAISFESLKSKYKNIRDIPLEDLYAVLQETGYKYITDMLSLDENSLRTFISFLNFIHINKGSRKGLEFAFRLLDIDYEIEEWWEKVPQGEDMTFDLNLVSFNPLKAGSFEVLDRIVNFTRNYVYPLINRIMLEFEMDKTSMYLATAQCGSVGYTAYPDTEYLIWDVFKWDEKKWYISFDELIWDVDNWDEKRWKDELGKLIWDINMWDESNW